ncbi:MAG: hypothetical protein KatS3mg031_2502 [Chitinophagales bacterium]|nr:MAG: hypothetical protein KatS3mg031_2502 [Chitinophagales bacterium]
MYNCWAFKFDKNFLNKEPFQILLIFVKLFLRSCEREGFR